MINSHLLYDLVDLLKVVHHGLQPVFLLVQLLLQLLQLLHDLYLDLCLSSALVIQYVATEEEKNLISTL